MNPSTESTRTSLSKVYFEEGFFRGQTFGTLLGGLDTHIEQLVKNNSAMGVSGTKEDPTLALGGAKTQPKPPAIGLLRVRCENTYD